MLITLPFCSLRKNQKANAAAGMKDQACSMEITKFYIAEVVVALEYLHNYVRISCKTDLLISIDLFISDFVGRDPP